MIRKKKKLKVARKRKSNKELSNETFYNSNYENTITMNGDSTINGAQILAENRKNSDGMIYYIYDAQGIAGMIRPGNYYYFEKNILGDVVKIYNSNGVEVGAYEYDAWGNITSQSGSMASVNPFRYRGYYYDKDLGWYYLQTRYYNPQWGRFLNADGYISTGTGLFGYNMYAYCNNNPVNKIDSQGTWPRWITATVAVGSLIVCGASLVTGNVALAYGAWKVGAIATTALAIQSWHYDDRAKKNEGVPDTLQGLWFHSANICLLSTSSGTCL